MKDHNYKIKTEWSGNLGEGTSSYTSYSRDHTISSEVRKNNLHLSSDPNFRGNPDKYNPEELFLSSLSSCHMLWYLHICASNNIVVTAYEDHATGIMQEARNGSGQFKEVVLHPVVTVSESWMIEKAILLHKEAHAKCFIANSCNFPVKHRPESKI